MVSHWVRVRPGSDPAAPPLGECWCRPQRRAWSAEGGGDTGRPLDHVRPTRALEVGLNVMRRFFARSRLRSGAGAVLSTITPGIAL